MHAIRLTGRTVKKKKRTLPGLDRLNPSAVASRGSAQHVAGIGTKNKPATRSKVPLARCLFSIPMSCLGPVGGSGGPGAAPARLSALSILARPGWRFGASPASPRLLLRHSARGGVDGGRSFPFLPLGRTAGRVSERFGTAGGTGVAASSSLGYPDMNRDLAGTRASTFRSPPRGVSERK